MVNRLLSCSKYAVLGMALFAMIATPANAADSKAPVKTAIVKDCSGVSIIVNKGVMIGGTDAEWRALEYKPLHQDDLNNSNDVAMESARIFGTGPNGLPVAQPLSVLIGEPIKTVTIDRQRTGYSGSIYGPLPSAVDEICHILQLRTILRSRTINWAEGNHWNLQATLTLQSGKKVSLLTDGSHVQFQDVQGTYWFVRAGD